jgi:hypothetical protein
MSGSCDVVADVLVLAILDDPPSAFPVCFVACFALDDLATFRVLGGEASLSFGFFLIFFSLAILNYFYNY